MPERGSVPWLCAEAVCCLPSIPATKWGTVHVSDFICAHLYRDISILSTYFYLYMDMPMFSSCVEMLTAKKCLCIYLTVQRLCVSMCRGLACFLLAISSVPTCIDIFLSVYGHVYIFFLCRADVWFRRNWKASITITKQFCETSSSFDVLPFSILSDGFTSVALPSLMLALTFFHACVSCSTAPACPRTRGPSLTRAVADAKFDWSRLCGRFDRCFGGCRFRLMPRWSSAIDIIPSWTLILKPLLHWIALTETTCGIEIVASQGTMLSGICTEGLFFSSFGFARVAAAKIN